jgi:hypothetical protein
MRSALLDAGPIVATIFVCLTRSAYNGMPIVTVKAWLDAAIQDAERRGLPALRPLLEALARSTAALRTADWNADATGESDAARAPNER